MTVPPPPACSAGRGVKKVTGNIFPSGDVDVYSQWGRW